MSKWFAFFCVLLFVSSTSAFDSATAQPGPYRVDGLALGGKVRFESEEYKQYRCTPSDKFPGFTWCHKEKTATANRGACSSNSILHDQDGTAVYVNCYIEPASFGRNDVRTEIDRLSARFGERAREFRMPHREGLPDAIIAVWGKIELEQLGAADVLTVASGGSHKGLLVSFLGDLERSAKAGVSVYQLAGGAGFLWAATFNENGRGALRFLTIDASQIARSTLAQNPRASPPESPTPESAAVPSPPSRSISVPLQRQGGTYVVPVLINNTITLNSVVDSGAADVSIPADVVLTLMRTGTLQNSDFIGSKTYTLADGSTAPSTTFRIHSLTVGSTIIEEVIGSIAPVEGVLLLGQSFLTHFKSWSIDNARQVLVLEPQDGKTIIQPKQTEQGSKRPFRAVGASDGILNIRKGPGPQYEAIAQMPMGATGLVGRCVPLDNDWKPFCEVEWQGVSGWASSCCMADLEQLKSPSRQAQEQVVAGTAEPIMLECEVQGRVVWPSWHDVIQIDQTWAVNDYTFEKVEGTVRTVISRSSGVITETYTKKGDPLSGMYRIGQCKKVLPGERKF